MSMLQHYIKLAFRNLIKYKSQSVISIIGLAIGFTCFALSTLWIRYEQTYDTFHKGADRIYLVRVESYMSSSGISEITPYPLAGFLKATFPEVEDACNMQAWGMAFKYKGKEYTPQSFTESLGLNMDDYVELTSFTHKPSYETFSPEVPDNWENQPMYNLPLDELIGAIDYALNKGYTVCWDGDVSEQGFSFKNGIAINPQVEDVKDYSTTDRARFEKMPKYQRMDEVFKFEHPYPEINVTPEIRQDGYEKFVTTDDHLMHITGIVKDQNGTKYYITKNSWGADSNKSGGYLNMSESYVRAKTICVMVHKDSLPKELKKKLGIQ